MSAKKVGLGRSFESLIPTDLFDGSFDPTSNEDSKVSKLVELPLKNVSPDEEQPRRHFDKESLDDLANSIKEYGVLQPIVVVKNQDNLYTIVAGERRWRASKLAGLKTVPAIVRSLDNQRKLEVSLIENVKRRDLNPLEIATAYLKLREQFNLTLEEIGQRVGGKSVSAISNYLRLLRLPDCAKSAIVSGELSEGQARMLVMADAEIIERILPTIIKESWSSRKIEQFMVQVRGKKVTAKKDSKSLKGETMPYEIETKKFEKALNSKVVIRTSSRGSGQIIIKFKDKNDFKRQMKLLIK